MPEDARFPEHGFMAIQRAIGVSPQLGECAVWRRLQLPWNALTAVVPTAGDCWLHRRPGQYGSVDHATGKAGSTELASIFHLAVSCILHETLLAPAGLIPRHQNVSTSRWALPERKVPPSCRCLPVHASSSICWIICWVSVLHAAPRPLTAVSTPRSAKRPRPQTTC